MRGATGPMRNAAKLANRGSSPPGASFRSSSTCLARLRVRIRDWPKAQAGGAIKALVADEHLSAHNRVL